MDSLRPGLGSSNRGAGGRSKGHRKKSKDHRKRPLKKRDEDVSGDSLHSDSEYEKGSFCASDTSDGDISLKSDMSDDDEVFFPSFKSYSK